jgi:2,3-bisphosphoglycerate-independent phosphoglycerate mutase
MSSDSETKYVILVPDGMADSPIEGLGDRTPLQVAETPWMDRMAASGQIGLTRTVPEGMAAGSDVANLSIVGYSPSDVYTGRAPLEAAAMGIPLKDDDLAFRMNLVMLEQNYTVMEDHSADHIPTSEAKELVEALRPAAEALGFALHQGVSYRHLLVWGGGPDGSVTHPPHDFPGDEIDRYLPSGAGAERLIRMIIASWKILQNHPINEDRIRRGQGPANSVWPWGQGRPPRIRTLTERFGITGSVVAAVDLIKGIGKFAGLEAPNVPGATGYLDTNYEGKVNAALDSLKTNDFVWLHVEAPDEAAHSGKQDLKIKAIEDFDERVLGPILKGLGEFKHWRVLLLPDHHTPVAARIHTSDPVPFVLLDSDDWTESSNGNTLEFSEQAAESSGTMVEKAEMMIEMLLQRENSSQ